MMRPCCTSRSIVIPTPYQVQATTGSSAFSWLCSGPHGGAWHDGRSRSIPGQGTAARSSGSRRVAMAVHSQPYIVAHGCYTGIPSFKFQRTLEGLSSKHRSLFKSVPKCYAKNWPSPYPPMPWVVVLVPQHRHVSGSFKTASWSGSKEIPEVVRQNRTVQFAGRVHQYPWFHDRSLQLATGQDWIGGLTVLVSTSPTSQGAVVANNTQGIAEAWLTDWKVAS
ncbi:hypothetical protein PR202_gb29573 [Eleusine coracana subsp. coracana]|uniref:Uncharacterized protein n=1 Tax=Eleusine coracana subsp. coracana TaxID=191504 RepID=A0AAV5FZE1_ELECO|nr:hypothetical protein PR202_gb29573 [Eleusine coracana subsp. coracana]